MNMTLNNTSLILSSSLVFIALIFSYAQNLKLEKDIIIAIFRAVIQLLLIGFLLTYIFKLESYLFTSLLILFMILNAARTSSKKISNIPNIFRHSFISISISAFITIFILVFSKAIKYVPQQVIPISGMIISNAMVALSLTLKNLSNNFVDKRKEIETKLSLGADILPSSIDIIRDSIKTGMTPTIDSAKTLGIVSLPGMMSGLILAGISPIEAVKYQIMVTFMLIGTTSISSFIVSFLSYKEFFNDRKQLL